MSDAGVCPHGYIKAQCEICGGWPMNDETLLKHAASDTKQKWKGEGCCILLPDGAVICVKDEVTASSLRKYHNATLERGEADVRRVRPDWIRICQKCGESWHEYVHQCAAMKEEK